MLCAQGTLMCLLQYDSLKAQIIILPKLIKKFIALIAQSSIVITYPDTLFKWPHCFVLLILLFQRLVNLLCKDLIASYEARRRG